MIIDIPERIARQFIKQANQAGMRVVYRRCPKNSNTFRVHTYDNEAFKNINQEKNTNEFTPTAI